MRFPFESLVNTEGFQTVVEENVQKISLRVLLIRKDFKPGDIHGSPERCLRVLLIRKDFKRSDSLRH